MEVDLEGFSLTWPDLTSPAFIPLHFRGEVRNEKEWNLKENSTISKERFSNKRSIPSYCQTKAKATYNSFELVISVSQSYMSQCCSCILFAFKKLGKVLKSKKKIYIFMKTTRTAKYCVLQVKLFYRNQPQLSIPKNIRTSERSNYWLIL